MDKFAGLEAFINTIEENGFSAAARKLGVVTSSVTRLAEMLNAESCPTADRVFTALEPLPSRNFAGLLTLLIEIGSADDDEEDGDSGPFAICKTANS